MLTRVQKEELLEKIKSDLSQPALILIDYRGLKVGEISQLRSDLASRGMNLKVAKNTLLRRALQQSGQTLPAKILDRPLAYVIASDELTPSKLVDQFGREHENLEILGGLISGGFVAADRIKYLASLPGQDELYAKLVGSLSAPISGLTTVLGGNLRGLASVLKQYQLQNN